MSGKPPEFVEEGFFDEYPLVAEGYLAAFSLER